MANEFLHNEGLALARLLDSKQKGSRASSTTGVVSTAWGNRSYTSGVATPLDLYDLTCVSFEAYFKQGVQYHSDVDQGIVHMIENCDGEQVVKEKVIDYIFQVPFEELPLHLNSKLGVLKDIVNWRFKIGR